jgi:hypothetical protein
MEVAVTAIAGIVFNKFLEKSGDKLAEAFSTQAGGAIAKIADRNPKVAEALESGDPQVIDAEVVESVQLQAQSDPELQAMLAEMALHADLAFAQEEVAKLKASSETNKAAETIRAVAVSTLKRKGKIQISDIDQEVNRFAKNIEIVGVQDIEGEGDLIIGNINQKI